MGEVIRAADLFCGAGGTSTGLVEACKAMGRKLDLVAINHWEIALLSHKQNHPDARHIWAYLESLNPREVVPGQALDILVASPECIFHSNARGGKPIQEQLRASAWCVLRWAEALQPKSVLIENVPEFRKWGPLGTDGKPIKGREGETYQAYLNALRSLGYAVDDSILNAANYGDATSRRRLFIMASKSAERVEWPKHTHSEHGENGLPRWKSAREIIDWCVKGESIFHRARPLAPRTIDRIAHGLRKFGGANAEPFLVMLYGSNNVRSVYRPLPTVTAGGNHIGLCEPFLCSVNHGGGGDRSYGLGKPLPTVTTKNGYALVEPFILPHAHGKDLDEILRNTPARSIDRPLQTITANSSNHIGLVEPFITIMKGKSTVRAIDDPLPTVTTQGHLYLCEPFLVKYNGTGKANSVHEPLDTITTKHRFGLVEPVRMDILFRMLQPHELAAAMSLKGYKFAGSKRDVIKQIGNAVPAEMAQKLCEALLAA